MADQIAILTETDQSGRTFREAFLHFEPKLGALRKEQLMTPNVPIPRLVSRLLGAMGEIMALRAAIAEELARFELSNLDELEGRTRCLGYAHSQFLASTTPEESIPQLLEDTRAKIAVLEADLAAAATRGTINAPQLFEAKQPETYEEVGFRLLKLARIAGNNLPKLQGKSALTAAEVDQCEELADRLLTALGKKAEGPKAISDAAETRARAYTLFYQAYTQVRRALTYLRWDEKDLDSILPALHPGRGRSQRSPWSPTPDPPTAAVPRQSQ